MLNLYKVDFMQDQSVMHPDVQALIAHFEFKPLSVESTLFRETYVTPHKLADGTSPIGTAMLGLYCDAPYSVSLFHRLTVDEVWHFYAGDPLRLILLYPDGTSRDLIMGNDPLIGQHVQFVVPAGVWQAGHMLAGGRYSLYGCTLAPGFSPSIFEGGTYDRLIASYPDRADDLRVYGCPPDATRMTDAPHPA
jgi:predicted cupin superfamily sugar epimerase